MGNKLSEATRAEIEKYKDPAKYAAKRLTEMQDRLDSLLTILADQRKFKVKAEREVRQLQRTIKGIKSGRFIFKVDTEGDIPPEVLEDARKLDGTNTPRLGITE